MNEAHIQSTLLGWILPLAITISILLRREKNLRQRLFILFSGNITLFYLFSFLYAWRGEPWFERSALAVAVLIPQGGLRFFRAFSTGARGMGRLGGMAALLGLILLFAVLYPAAPRPAVGPAVLAYVAGFMLVAILNLNVQAKQAPTQVDAARIRYLVTLGFLTLSFQIIDRIDHVFEVDIPPIGLAMTIIYLFIISQTLVQYRILDLHETMGRFAVLFLMGLTLSLIYGGLVFWSRDEFSINAFLASLVILILFDPLSDLVERKIAEFFFRERHILEQEVAGLRRALSHLIDMEEMVGVLKKGLEQSKRLTHAALYLIDTHGRGFDLKMSVGPDPELGRVESALARIHLQPHLMSGVMVASALAVYRERLLQNDDREKAQAVGETLDLMDALMADLVMAIHGENQLFGFISIRDDRRKDPFSPEDVDLYRGLAGQIVITVENSRLYQQTKERDRLAALGRMAAGLAHEIRNPLGSIKGAAQVVEEIVKSDTGSDSQVELLKVIVEEVDRLDRVVYDFLTYARPGAGRPRVLNVNDIVERTVQVFTPRLEEKIDIDLNLSKQLPMVRVDSEQLHQVFLNLLLNAAEAMRQTPGPHLEITTCLRPLRTPFDESSDQDVARRIVEICFADNGPGLAADTLENIFIPFFTTKEKGSGLGLSICQRIIRSAGGEIDVRSQLGEGTIFTINLPVVSKEDNSVRARAK